MFGILRLTSVGLGLLCLSTATATLAFTPVFHPEMTTQSAEAPIEIDGDLDDPGWRFAGRANNFAEHNPGDQVQPPVDTEA